ncbi:WD40 repeat domain-containing protein [Vibrio sp.]|nr:WD40 repeat domain-containing protein [Vibrio sp.]
MTLKKHVTIISLAALLAACGSDGDSNDASNTVGSSNSGESTTSQPADNIDTDGDGIVDSEDDDDDNDGIPDSEDPDDDNDGILDEDEVTINTENLSCNDNSLEPFSVVETSASNQDDTSIGFVNFEWQAVNTTQPGNVTYTVCEVGEGDSCLPLSTTVDTNVIAATGGALHASKSEYFIHAQQNGAQSCSDIVSLDKETVDGAIGGTVKLEQISKDGKTAVAVAVDAFEYIKVLKEIEGQLTEVHTITAKELGVPSIQFKSMSADGSNILLTAFEDAYVVTDNGKKWTASLVESEGSFPAFLISGDGKTIISKSKNEKHLLVSSLMNGAWVEQFRTTLFTWRDIEVSHDGKTLALMGHDGVIRVYEENPNWALTAEFTHEDTHTQSIYDLRSLTLSGDGSTILSAFGVDQISEDWNTEMGFNEFKKINGTWSFNQTVTSDFHKYDSTVNTITTNFDGTNAALISKNTRHSGTGIYRADEAVEFSDQSEEWNRGEIFVYEQTSGNWDNTDVIISPYNQYDSGFGYDLMMTNDGKRVTTSINTKGTPNTDNYLPDAGAVTLWY